MRTRTYVRKGTWHLGRGRKITKGGFFTTSRKPLLSTIASVAGPPVLGFLGKKIFGGRRRKRRRCRCRIRY